MTFGRFIALLMFVSGFGIAGVTYDYYVQSQKAEDDAYDHDVYIVELYDRFGQTGGIVSLLLNPGYRVSMAMPDAPEGWVKNLYADMENDVFFSPSQAAVSDKEREMARAAFSFATDPSGRDKSIYADYVGHTSYSFTRQGERIDLYIYDTARPVPAPYFAAYREHRHQRYQLLETARPFATLQGVTWTEVESEVERADNGDLPHTLRTLRAKLGSMRLTVMSRAQKESVILFLSEFDFSALRELSGAAPAPEVPVAAVTSITPVSGLGTFRPVARPSDLATN